jgi:hypothetical protein
LQEYCLPGDEIQEVKAFRRNWNKTLLAVWEGAENYSMMIIVKTFLVINKNWQQFQMLNFMLPFKCGIFPKSKP